MIGGPQSIQATVDSTILWRGLLTIQKSDLRSGTSEPIPVPSHTLVMVLVGAGVANLEISQAAATHSKFR
jgi:hypothetical protein